MTRDVTAEAGRHGHATSALRVESTAAATAVAPVRSTAAPNAVTAGRAGATPPAPARRPSIFPLMPRFTWIGDGEPTTFEVCVTVDAGRVAVIARDALAAAGLTLGEFDREPDCRATPYASHADATAWPFALVADILAPVADRPQPTAFLRWLERRVEDLERYGLHRLSPAQPDQPGPTRARRDFYSVREAARILDRDPVISIGQGRLFEYLAALGWITRRGNAWHPAAGIPARGLLAIQNVSEHHFSRDEPYPQVILTPAGIHELHRLLGGTAALDLTDHPTLIEE